MDAPAPDTAALPQDGEEHRLHALSWLFVLIAQAKQFIIPLLVLLFAGRGDRNDLWGLIAVGVLVATSLAQYFTYRYRLLPDAIVIRSGWLHRSRREIPYARIHNVNLHQSLLHRLVGVAEVRLESAGGVKPEAQMRVLRLDQARDGFRDPQRAYAPARPCRCNAGWHHRSGSAATAGDVERRRGAAWPDLQPRHAADCGGLRCIRADRRERVRRGGRPLGQGGVRLDAQVRR